MAIKDGTNGADNLSGTAGSDTLRGLGGNDILKGLAGSDTLEGGAGEDTLDGGDGLDTVSYDGAGQGVSVDLLSNKCLFGDALGDQLFGFENVSGSQFVDVIRGNNLANVLRGNAGSDILDGSGGDDRLIGGAGADTLIGGDGSDTADYSTAKQGVSMSLLRGVGGSGDASGDSYDSIENVTGSAFGDTLVGSAAANVLKGGGGGDLLEGNLGRDVLTGGKGGDLFFFTQTAHSGTTAATRDVVRDFRHGQEDKLFLGLVDPNTGEQFDLTFIDQKGFTAAGQIRFFFEGDHTVVAVNTVGSSGAEMQIELDGRIDLAATDFAFGG